MCRAIVSTQQTLMGLLVAVVSLVNVRIGGLYVGVVLYQLQYSTPCWL